MIKRMVPLLLAVVMFFGLIIPQDSLGVLKPNLNAAQAKSSGNPANKNQRTLLVVRHAKAKENARKKIREAQSILDNNFGPRYSGVNHIQNRMSELIPLINNLSD